MIAIDKWTHNYNNLFTPGPDKILWKHFKLVIRDDKYLDNNVNITNGCITNGCINLGHWPLYFKASLSIIIPKPNKVAYDSPKSFHSIVLLNMLGKLIEKVISKHFQYHLVVNNFIHPN